MSYLIVKWNRSGKLFPVVPIRWSQSLVDVVPAPHGTEACDAVGGALRPK